jgi:hypothetical protein
VFVFVFMTTPLLGGAPLANADLISTSTLGPAQSADNQA